LCEREAAMAADVQERAQLAVARAGDDDGSAPGMGREERPRLGRLARVADVLPRRAEDPLLLAAQDLRVGVPRVGERRLHGPNLPAYDDDREAATQAGRLRERASAPRHRGAA